jgi:hypothetical protein
LCLTATGYIVIGGQHVVEALRKRRGELLEARLEVPEPYSHVLATVLKHETPLGVRLFAAGDSQAAQAGFEHLGLEDVARLFLQGEPSTGWTGARSGGKGRYAWVENHPLL